MSAQWLKVAAPRTAVHARVRRVTWLHHVTGSTTSRHGAAGRTAHVSALFTARFVAYVDPAGVDISVIKVSLRSTQRLWRRIVFNAVWLSVNIITFEQLNIIIVEFSRHNTDVLDWNCFDMDVCYLDADPSDTAAVSLVPVTRGTAVVPVACTSVWATGTAAVLRLKETSDTADAHSAKLQAKHQYIMHRWQAPQENESSMMMMMMMISVLRRCVISQMISDCSYH